MATACVVAPASAFAGAADWPAGLVDAPAAGAVGEAAFVPDGAVAAGDELLWTGLANVPAGLVALVADIADAGLLA